MPKSHLLKDLTGQTFGSLTVIGRAPPPVRRTGHQQARWLCECKCGERRAFDGQSLRRKQATSCGCLRRRTEPKPKAQPVYRPAVIATPSTLPPPPVRPGTYQVARTMFADARTSGNVVTLPRLKFQDLEV